MCKILEDSFRVRGQSNVALNFLERQVETWYLLESKERELVVILGDVWRKEF